MGEAKRRKKLDPNFGQIQLEVQLKPNIELPVELEKLKQILLKEGKKWEVGEVSIKGKTYPAEGRGCQSDVFLERRSEALTCGVSRLQFF